MKSYKSDIEIARLAKLKPIQEILGNINMEDKAEYYSPIGRYMAKVKLEYLNRLKNKENGKKTLQKLSGDKHKVISGVCL